MMREFQIFKNESESTYSTWKKKTATAFNVNPKYYFAMENVNNFCDKKVYERLSMNQPEEINGYGTKWYFCRFERKERFTKNVHFVFFNH